MYGTIEIHKTKKRTRALVVALILLLLAVLYLFYAHFTISSSPVLELSVNDYQLLKQPTAYKSHNGVLEATLTMQTTRFQNGPVAFNTRTYNGMFPGPTLCVKPGDTMRITLINQLLPDGDEGMINTMHNPNTTNLHVHGMHVSPSGLSDNVLRKDASGESLDMVIEIPKDHPLGIYHYHPHYHGSVFVQMGGGMVGAISVQEDTTEVDSVLILQSFSFEGDILGNLDDAAKVSNSSLLMNAALTNQAHQRIADFFPDYQPRYHAQVKDHPPFYIVNGQYLPRIPLQECERKAFYIVNGGPTDILQLHVPGCSMEVFSKDSFPPANKHPKYVVVPPGGRVGIIFECQLNGKPSGVFPLVSLPHHKDDDYMGKDTDIYHGVLALFHVEPAIKPLLSNPPMVVNEMNDLSNIKPQDEHIERFVMKFSSGSDEIRNGVVYTKFLMNDHSFSMDHKYQMKLNVLQEWTLMVEPIKKGKWNHPFHIHTNPFQIIEITPGKDIDYSVGDWRDTITLPLNGNVTIRFRPVDFTGMIVAHCHIVGHSDAGMIMLIEITP
ncbi:hypothetical protein THRCLA_10113, partial [Thraustotheca clavata]